MSSPRQRGTQTAGLRKERLAPPLMFVFRTAAAAGDARMTRQELGERHRLRADGSEDRSARFSITEPELRREVARDLAALVNTTDLASSVPMDDLPYAKRSIVNYGLPDLAHRTIDENSVDLVGTEMIAAIMRYEPRLHPASLKVVRDNSVKKEQLRVRFHVSGDLRCDPVDLPVQFVADVEVDTGKIRIDRLQAPT